MVCSQVYSQHPSQNVPANAQQHRYWDPDNAEVYRLEPETSEGNWSGSTVHDGHLWPSKVNACSGPANTPSPFKSSWIQRLIPSHGTRAEQTQIAENLISESHGINGVQVDWKENATYPPLTGNQFDSPVYENSRRSKQDFFSGHQTFLDSNTTRGALNGVNITVTSRRFDPSEAMQPEVSVFPKTVPIVESLLPGSSKRIFYNQISSEINKPHILSKCTRFSNQINQTVHYSADERSRVSCSSIQGLNSRSDSFTVEALNARGGAFDGGGGLLVPNMRKDEPQRVSDLGFSHYRANVAKERASISLSYHTMEQGLISSHDSHEEQGGMSRSFSFQFANRLSYDPDHEAGMVCISRSRRSPYFGTENLTESARHVAQDGGIEKGKARPLKGGHIFSRSESDLMIEGMEWKELKYSHPFRTVSVDNWNPSSRSTIPPVGADGNLCYSTGSIGSCSKRSANLCTENPSTSVEAMCRHTLHGRPEALTPAAVKRHSYSSETQSASKGLNVACDGREYEGREVVGWEGSGVKQNMWLRRWSTTRSREGLSVCKSNRESAVFAGMAHTRKGYSISQGIKESSHCFDLRPAKRICYEERIDLQSEPGKVISKISSIAMGRKHSKSGVASHFVKRFFTPSAAAMAVMGMTARKVHGTQPQGRGLFGVWALNASTSKPPATEMCEKFSSIDKTELHK